MDPQSTRRYHDATIGINCDVLSCHADLLFGYAPEEANCPDELTPTKRGTDNRNEGRNHRPAFSLSDAQSPRWR